jgi:mannobiose 2-epimerase
LKLTVYDAKFNKYNNLISSHQKSCTNHLNPLTNKKQKTTCLRNILSKIFQKPADITASQSVLSQLREELDESLKNLLDAWYPDSIDYEHGGFYTDLNNTFDPEGAHLKSVVHQSRHLWTLSRACARFPQTALFREASEHEFRFIADHFWDQKHGGFYSEVNRKGYAATPDQSIIAFGQSFAMYGIIAYHNVTQSQESLKLAIDTFYWLEQYMYDPVDKGYFSFTDMDRNIIGLPDYTGCLDGPCMKGINSILHLLEAYTELYKIWPDSLLYERLWELLEIIEDKMVQEKGYLHNYFDKDWTPVCINKPSKSNVRRYLYLDHVSFGHDAEAAFLMQEARSSKRQRSAENASRHKETGGSFHNLWFGPQIRRTVWKGVLFQK